LKPGVIKAAKAAGKFAKPPGGSETRPRKIGVSKTPILSLADRGVDKNLAQARSSGDAGRQAGEGNALRRPTRRMSWRCARI
jgi:hypothetical protein